MDLIEFLRPRLDEDEAAARAAAPAPWTYSDIESVAGGRLYDGNVAIAGVNYDPIPAEIDTRIHRVRHTQEADATGTHIVRWDPARVLAEVEAKRQIIDVLELAGDSAFHADAWVLAREALRELAQPYREHPEYDPSWAVSEAYRQRWVMGAP